MSAFALLLAAATTASANADVSLAVELPRWNTPVGRFLYGRDNVSAPDLGIRAAVTASGKRAWQPYLSQTVRGGRTRAQTPMAQLRWELDLRGMPDWSCNINPYLELGAGGEALWFNDPDGGSQIQIGGGPSASLGFLGDGAGFRGLLGLRATAAWMPGAYTIETDRYGYRFQPANLGLALFVGKLF